MELLASGLGVDVLMIKPRANEVTIGKAKMKGKKKQ